MKDIILPKLDKVELWDRSKKEKYEVDLFISGAVGLKLMSKLDAIGRVFNSQATDADIDTMFDIFEMVLSRQYKFMDRRWCENNLDMASTMALTMSIAEPIFEYLKLMGIPVMPEEKNLDESENTDGIVMS